MRVAYLFNRSSEDPTHVAEDEVSAASPVMSALRRLGHHVSAIPCTLDLAKVRSRLVRVKPDVVFNRVESLGGSDAMMGAITLLLDSMQIPYTGNSTAALVATANKTEVKQRLLQAGLPTPRWMSGGGRRSGVSGRGANAETDQVLCPQSTAARYIVKSVFEHASFEMDDASVVDWINNEQMMELVREREAETGRAYFAEEFIEGREFNLSVLGEPPHVLPPAEIDFSNFPDGKLRIVGHGAKWDAESFEFHHTPRRFDFSNVDQPLLQRLTELAIECWRLFELCGYARVDFRCDAAGQPWILEINSNPCIAPESGFAAALERAGIGYDEGIRRILDDAITGHQTAVPPVNRHQMAFND